MEKNVLKETAKIQVEYIDYLDFLLFYSLISECDWDKDCPTAKICEKGKCMPEPGNHHSIIPSNI